MTTSDHTIPRKPSFALRKSRTRRIVAVDPAGEPHAVTEYTHFDDGDAGAPGRAVYRSYVLDSGECVNLGADERTLVCMRSGRVLRLLTP